MSAASHRVYRPDIDGLRAVAVLAVLLFHADVGGFGGGYVGVDVFFVISGYLITRNILQDIGQGTWSFSRFYVRRARRLFPALFATLVLVFVAGFLTLTPELFANLAKSTLFASASISNFLFWSEADYFDTAAELKPLLHTWSLAVEEQFYLVWPALIVLVAKLRAPLLQISAITVIGILSLLSAELALGEDPYAVFYLTPFRMAEFCIGGLTVWLVGRDVPWIMKEVLLAIGLVCIGAAVVGFDGETRFPGLSALLPCAGTAAAIVAGEARYAGALLRNRVAVQIGLVSYSLYLVHWPLLVFYKYLVNRPLVADEQVLLIAGSIALAFAMYRFVEVPLRYPGTPAMKPAHYLAACALCVLAVSVPAAHALVEKGWPWRLSPQAESRSDLKNRGFKRIRVDGEPGYFIGERSSGAPDLLLIGDSHAGHLTRGLDWIGRRHGLKIQVYSMPACPAVLYARKVFPPRFEQQQEACDDRVLEWHKLLAETPAEVIVVSGRWSLLTEPESFGSVTVRRDLLAGPDGKASTLEVSRRAFARSMTQLAEEVSRRGKKLIIFGQVPFLGNNPSGCGDLPRFVAAPALIEARCQTMDFQLLIDRLTFSNGVIGSAAAAAGAGVLAILPSEYLCDERQRSCSVFSGSVELYRDAHHLSAAGSVFLGRLIESDLVGFLQRTGVLEAREAQPVDVPLG